MSTNHAPFASWFSEADASLDTVAPICSPEARFVRGALRSAQRFYLPVGSVMTREGTPYEPNDRLLYRLPFAEGVAIATEEPAVDRPGQFIRTITCAAETPEGMQFTWVAFEPESKRWGVFPVARASWRDDTDQIEVTSFMTPYAEALYGVSEQGKHQLRQDRDGCLVTIHNLCLLLSLSNTRRVAQMPPAKVNAKRVKAGRLPLYAYQVLEVGGDVWDSAGRDLGDGQGYRSHLRRGHIRRLGDGHVVWVRAAFVHGRQDGFVDKDYEVKGPDG